MTTVMVNPGTEPVWDVSLENARENMNQLVLDCGFSLDEVVIFEVKNKHRNDGRFKFTMSRIGYEGVEIDMPGCLLEKVRYLDESQDIWQFPRLYINGSSFVWKFVVELAQDHLNTRLGERNEEDW